MKRVINGKRYDTDTARYICSWSNHRKSGDFDECEQSLYLTRNGQYFIAGYGGARSIYSVSSGCNSWGGGEGMELVSEAAALEWCEHKEIDTETIVKNFAITEG